LLCRFRNPSKGPGIQQSDSDHASSDKCKYCFILFDCPFPCRTGRPTAGAISPVKQIGSPKADLILLAPSELLVGLGIDLRFLSRRDIALLLLLSGASRSRHGMRQALDTSAHRGVQSLIAGALHALFLSVWLGSRQFFAWSPWGKYPQVGVSSLSFASNNGKATRRVPGSPKATTKTRSLAIAATAMPVGPAK
jgi:hypothetical protein